MFHVLLPLVLHILTFVLFLRSTRAEVLVDFQVHQPLTLPKDVKQCTIPLFDHTFAESEGMPINTTLTPPSDCGKVGTWAGISLNFTVTSNGSQFDRLAIFTFQNVEIWRSSTPEPTQGDGIIWTYIKDVTRYSPLFEKPGSFVLDLGNLEDSLHNGLYHARLSITYYASSSAHPAAKKSDGIIPLSTPVTGTDTDGSVPPAFSVNVTLPRNTVKAFAEIYAHGNGNEEFWYSNVANEFLSALPSGTTFGNGPFREVRVLVDGTLAGAAFPYATVFTGGDIPNAWRPITSYAALDLPTYFMDLTPFVPILADGDVHSVTIDVSSAESNHTINSNWIVSGNIQVILDPTSKPTTGHITHYSASPFSTSNISGVVGASGDVLAIVTASRELHIEADVIGGSGKSTHIVWKQALGYINTQTFVRNATLQTVVQRSNGSFSSTHNGAALLADAFDFPFNLNMTAFPDGVTFNGTFDHTYDRTLLPSSLIVESTIRNRQIAGGFLFFLPNGSHTGNGTCHNVFSYSDKAGNTYDREVDAAFDKITLNNRGGNLARGV